MTQQVVEFEWCQKSNEVAEPLRCSVEIPNSANLEELAFRLVKENGLPFYVKAELQSAMEAFVKQKTSSYFDRKSECVLRDRLGIDISTSPRPNIATANTATGATTTTSSSTTATCTEVKNSAVISTSDQDGGSDVQRLVEDIARSYREEYREFANISNGIDSDEEFSLLYHNLMHSGAQLEVIRVEAEFSARTRAERLEMDAELMALIDKQNRELETSGDFNEHLLNTLASVHVEERQAFERNWRARQEALRSRQREAFLRWMMLAVTGDFTRPDRSVCAPAEEARDGTADGANSNVGLQEQQQQQQRSPGLSESFTIHLGSQLKVMHNLRLTCADLLDVFRWRSPEEALQTSMCLYSGQLQGAVLLVDNRVSSYKGIKREFAEICKSRAELHFPDIETQLAEVRAEFRKAASRTNGETSRGAAEGKISRNQHTSTSSSQRKAALSSTLSSTSEEDDADEVCLSQGDVYMTRHSNLGGVHVVFHLVAGSDEEELSRKELTSRHQVILGLRNILRIAHERDVRTLSIPLLLCNALNPGTMTSAWCVKRAELVYKCVKGFMIEMASLVAESDRDDPRTIEFTVPSALASGGATGSAGTSDMATFTALSSMLQGIFRMANPLVLQTNNNSSMGANNTTTAAATTTRLGTLLAVNSNPSNGMSATVGS